MSTGEDPQEPPVRREVVDLIRRLDVFGAHPGPMARISGEDRDLLASSTGAEKRAAAHEALRGALKARNVVRMADGTTAALPDDPEWG